MTKKSNALGMHLARRVDKRPLLMDAAFLPSLEGLIEKADAFYDMGRDEINALYEREKVMMLQAYGLPTALYGRDAPNSSTEGKRFAYADGTAIIPIHGTLVNRCDDTACGTMTGYNMIQNELAAAVADSDVERILFDVDSGGGEVSGCAETAQMIRDAGAVKPTMAFIDSSCYSAAYWLASAANKVVALSSGGVGSIGALIAHADYSEHMANEGVKITFIHAGKEKVSGNPYEPLSEDTKEVWQAEVDRIRERFAAQVAENRGLDVSAVMGTEARCFSADDALAIGLVDELSDPMHAMSLFGTEGRKSESADDKPSPKGAATDTTPKVVSYNETKGEAMDEQKLTEARREAAEAERTRVASILNSDEAKDRGTLAKHLALTTDMSAEACVGILSAAGKETVTQAVAEQQDKEAKSESARKAFENAMVATGNPNVGAGDGSDTSAKTEPTEDSADAIMAAFTAAGGAVKAR